MPFLYILDRCSAPSAGQPTALDEFLFLTEAVVRQRKTSVDNLCVTPWLQWHIVPHDGEVINGEQQLSRATAELMYVARLADRQQLKCTERIDLGPGSYTDEDKLFHERTQQLVDGVCTAIRKHGYPVTAAVISSVCHHPSSRNL